jgi:Uma2 family endonuclease
MAAAASVAGLEKDYLKQPKPVSIATFFSKYAQAEDGYKYEYNNGIIEKTPRMITKKQWYIVDNLESSFVLTQAYKNGNRLFKEPEIWTSETQVRAPDLAYLTKKQIRKETPNDKTMTPFIIEVISPTDHQYKVLEKLKEYFDAGVEAAWLVLPDLGQVYVYTSPTEVTICHGNMKCFAGNMLKDFNITASDIFKK